ncbi:TPA: MMPL family transporter [Pseudomonas aeruginosa]|uniref:efflux RND transporter permease subunit n=1 Tax=Pseudomonas aeruginosa TaxID=287 RepID=UPI00071BE4BD|nr:MMPL family transporter [Pseudomonas aeruginosa]KSL70799.1 RND transporter [Pseudomonas aeruginosa]KSM83984.1 RND transporter [Pseudomonas aeruginosa]MDI2558831.1 MMPL family transporter [Pseudomonas aeruginosa]PXA56283.1 RND transporter [Pseudomonas aeruginosa]HBN9633852.1 MMPL family transporter [Pseudomonas aeruginosa]
MVEQKYNSGMPVVPDLRDFDMTSGGLFERMIFNNRALVVVACLLATLVLGFFASRLEVNASFERMIPSSSPYIKNYLAYKDQLPGLGNSIRVVVSNKQGDIYEPEYLQTLQEVNDKLYLIPGVDRSWMRSLWMPIVRWKEVTEEGIDGGAVMPADYDASEASIDTLRHNIARAGIVGSLVANDARSSMIVAPLLDTNPQTGEPLSYGDFSRQLEEQLRSMENDRIGIHIVGFSKLVGDLIDGLYAVMLFFGASVVIAALFVYFYTRCLRSTLLLVGIAVAGVVWLLGLMELLGYELDPYSILVPFLIFAIGVSHGTQKMNGILQDIGRGTHKYVAARYTFRRLFLTGLTALLCNIVGFAVLVIIDIPVIRDLALTTSIGVAVLIFTKLLLIPVALSYIGVSKKAALIAIEKDRAGEQNRGFLGLVWHGLDRFTERPWAIAVIALSVLVTAFCSVVMLDLKIGDLDPGAPELRPDSRYNRDNAFITANYGLSSDQFVVIMKTNDDGCRLYQPLQIMDQLAWRLRQTEGVQTTSSLAETVRFFTAGMAEGSGKWLTISRDQAITNSSVDAAMISSPGITNQKCSVTPLVAYLADHKADTLSRVLHVAEDFAREHNVSDGEQPVEFLLAAGSAGIEAATNIEVEKGIVTMYLAVYGATALLCLLTFRSWRATLVALIPLVMTTIICKALMVWLGIGLKVATLPVIAVGVGVGVDYALYLLSVQLAVQQRGGSLAVAYRRSLDFTGRVVALIGLTMAAGVITWAWSPIKFQADMGILLTFMFLWNMLGALVLIPALSHFLLRSKTSTESPEMEYGDEKLEVPEQAEKANVQAIAAH